MSGLLLIQAASGASIKLNESISGSISELFDKPEVWGIIGVVLGGLMTGFFNYWGVRSNNKIALSIKEKEIKSNKDQLLSQLNSTKELKTMELDHQKIMQNIEEESAKKLRLLDEKIRIFTEYYENYAKILVTMEKGEVILRCRTFRTTLHKLKLFAPSLHPDISKLLTLVVDYTNYWITEEHTSKKQTSHVKKIGKIGREIADELPRLLVQNG